MQPDTTGRDLRETVRLLNRRSDSRKLALERAKVLPTFWREAVNALLHRIEHIYLLEFLILDAIGITQEEVDIYLPGAGPVTVGSLVITVGDEAAALSPVVQQDRLHRVSMQLRSRRHHDVADLFCDLKEEQPRWMAVLRERGVRRLVEPYLPEKAVELNEEAFRSALDLCLRGPEPLFLLDGSQLSEGLGRLLDFATSDALRRSLATGLRSGASGLSRHAASAAPALKRSLQKALPQAGPPRPLLLESSERKQAEPDDVFGPEAPEAALPSRPPGTAL